MKLLDWVLSLVAAVILLQTLFFKFTGAPESVYIFETLGMEPWGRIGSGVAELLAAVLLLVPATRAWGAPLAMGLMAGAIGSHLTKLGIEVQGDGGLFALGILVFPARRRRRLDPPRPAAARRRPPAGRIAARDLLLGSYRSASRRRGRPHAAAAHPASESR